MERKTADRLIERLGMEYELAPMLDSDEAYVRFEEVILNILKELKGSRPKVVVGKRIYANASSVGAGPSGAVSLNDVSGIKEIRPIYQVAINFDKAIACFRVTYGLKIAQKSQEAIAKSRSMAKREGERYFVFFQQYSEHVKLAETWVREHHHYPPLEGAVAHQIRFVTDVLKQQHKNEIWQGMLR